MSVATSPSRAEFLLGYALRAAGLLGVCMLGAYLLTATDPGRFVLDTVPGWLALAGFGGVCGRAVWKSRLAGRQRWLALATDGLLVAVGGALLLGIYAFVLIQAADPAITDAHRNSLTQPILSSGAPPEMQAEALARVHAGYPLLFEPLNMSVRVAIWAAVTGTAVAWMAASLVAARGRE